MCVCIVLLWKIHTFFDVGLATLNNRTIRAYDMSVQLVSAQSSKSSLS